MAGVTEDLFFASIAELGAKLRAREFSSVELTRAYSDRLEKLGPRYNALALSLRESGIRQARNADYDLSHDRVRSPLTGIPFVVKDLLAVKGHPTAWGAKPYAAQVFDEDARVVQKLEKARAVLIGKVSMVELAGGGGYRFAAASMTGPGLNPWDRTRWSGGSSSGSAAAMAAGLAAFTLGSETSGSIMTPSAYCGVTGLRPTYGLVSRHGAMALSWTMDKIGPICRSADDCGIVLAAIAGGDADDPGSAGKGFAYNPQFARKPQDLTLGYSRADFEGWADPAARPAFEQALGVFKSIGVKLKEVELPAFPYYALTSTIILAEAAAIFEDFIRSGAVDQLADKQQIAGLKSALDISATDYLKAMRIRTLVQDAMRNLLIDCDMLLSPTLFGPANKVSDPVDEAMVPVPPPKSHGLRELIPAGNLAGLPGISLPCGFAGKLPVAVSLVGRPFSELHLIGLGRAFQSQTDWHKRRPPLQS